MKWAGEATHGLVNKLSRALVQAPHMELACGWSRGGLAEELRGFERRIPAMARQDGRTRRLVTTPGVGVLVALTFVAAVDDPERFRSLRAVGAELSPFAGTMDRQAVDSGATLSHAPLSVLNRPSAYLR